MAFVWKARRRFQHCRSSVLLAVVRWGASPPFSHEIGQRHRNQQERIAEGIKSGQLTAGETAHLEGREKAVNHEIAADRAANGGRLTGQERAQINRQQNRNSGAIYRKKHDARKQ